jgi:hypothetical protein
MIEHFVQPSARSGSVEGVERDFEPEAATGEFVGIPSRNGVVFEDQWTVPLPG